MSREKTAGLAAAWRTVIRGLGYDPQDAHLVDSPSRVARFMTEWHTMGKSPPKLTTFPNKPRCDELVVVSGIRFHSLCAHHGLPFVGTAAIGYVPGDKVLGLSKFARVVDHYANRFQVQEKLTTEVADYLSGVLQPVALGVVLRAEHFCMSMRGVKKGGHATTTSAMRGDFRDEAAARAELLALIREK
jgi:GTP cyclohydrolase I